LFLVCVLHQTPPPSCDAFYTHRRNLLRLQRRSRIKTKPTAQRYFVDNSVLRLFSCLVACSGVYDVDTRPLVDACSVIPQLDLIRYISCNRTSVRLIKVYAGIFRCEEKIFTPSIHRRKRKTILIYRKYVPLFLSIWFIMSRLPKLRTMSLNASKKSSPTLY